MDIMDKFSHKISQSARLLAQKSSDIVEINKLYMSIRKREEDILETYEEIGRYVYNQLRESNHIIKEELVSQMRKVDTLQNEVASLEKLIISIKNLKYCSACKEEYHEDVYYCPYCGKSLR
jgi:hypothetical protein